MLLVVWCVFEGVLKDSDSGFCGEVSVKMFVVKVVYNKVVDYVIKE